MKETVKKTCTSTVQGVENSVVILKHLPFSPEYIHKNETLADAFQRLIEPICLKNIREIIPSFDLPKVNTKEQSPLTKNIVIHFAEKAPSTWKKGFIFLERKTDDRKNSWEYFATLFLELHPDKPRAEATPAGSIRITFTCKKQEE